MKLTPKLYFSYSQFMVYDQSVPAPGCLWTEDHTTQGFARRESTVCFGTLFECGYAEVTYKLSSYISDGSYKRVIAVPFIVTSGKVIVDGPDENDIQRFVEIPCGNYRLVAAQRIVGVEEEVIDLFFEKIEQPMQQSRIIIADDQLEVSSPLLETSEIA